MKRLKIILLFAIPLLLLIYFLNKKFPYALSNVDSYPSIVKYLAILAFLFLGLSTRKMSFLKGMKYAFVWLGLLTIFAIGYSYRYDLKSVTSKLYGNLIPSESIQNSEQSVSIHANQQGHFMVGAIVNGQDVLFLVDTGATSITLTHNDAERLNIDMNNLNYNIITNTANGQVFSAPTKLEYIQIGDIVIKNIHASVTKADRLDISLLGMNFLKRLKSYEVKEGTMTFIGYGNQ